MFLFLN